MNIETYGPAPRTTPVCYPGLRPPGSYLLQGNSNSEIIPIKPADSIKNSNTGGVTLSEKLNQLDATPLEERYCIIGYGSNANPLQLQNKFKDDQNAVIPVLKATLTGYDIIYANSFAPYGSVPATITESPGTDVGVWINLLDSHQLKIMDETEGRNTKYWMAKLSGILTMDGTNTHMDPFSYVYTDGILDLGDGPIRLETVPAINSRFASLDQYQILRKLARLWDIGMIPWLFADDIARNCEFYRTKLRTSFPAINSTGYEKIINNTNIPKYTIL